MLTRRSFAASLLAVPAALARTRDLACDVAVIGGGVGGCAAALAALRLGMRVILTEETDWIGGQLTAQAVPPDEHPWIEAFGATRLYRQFRTDVRDYYRHNYPLTAAARRNPHLNPGNGTVSALTHEPRVALAVLEAMLAPFVSSGALVVLLRHKAASADVQGDHVRAVAVKDLETGASRAISASYFLDATEQGDLLPLAKAEYVTGFELQKDTGEPHASAEGKPGDIQSFTFCFAMDHRAGEDHTIDRPDEYAYWRDYVPQLRPPWTGKLLSLTAADPRTLLARKFVFDPSGKGSPNLWTYRRIVDKRNFEEGPFSSDICLVNWPQNDYWLGDLIDVPEQDAQRNILRAKQLSLSMLYWLQTEAGWPGLRLRPDIVGTEDGLAKYPYIRESRRILAEFTVKEQHVGTEARIAATGRDQTEVTAEHFPDSVGVGSYRIDLHPTSGGDNYLDISSLPFQIPLGALIPRRLDNLLPACKNIGTTHITNGCYRLHPVEWNIGEAAGALAAECIKRRTTPRGIRQNTGRLADFQQSLHAQGVETEWPHVLPR